MNETRRSTKTQYMHGLARSTILNILIIFTLCLTASPAISNPAAGPWYVAPGGSDANDCLTPAAPCATINAAIGKASPGDTVYVAEGTYTGEGDQVVLIDKNITLSGGWDSSFSSQDGVSTINGSALRRGILITEGVAATVNRFIVMKCATDYDEGASGIFMLDDSSLILNDSIVRNNVRSSDLGDGSGIGGTRANLILNRSSVSNNMGSGIVNEGNLTLNNSSIRYNMSGGISTGGNATLNDSTVDHNQGAFGGGIINWGSLTLNNSTVSANSAIQGGGIMNCCGNNDSAIITINNSTITGNFASDYGGGIVSSTGEIYPTITQMKNSILAGNTSASNPDCAGNLQSSGYNLIGDLSGGTIVCNFTPSTGDMTGLDPSLGPLIGSLENPQYHPLLPGGPAIDAGNPAGCTGSTGDLLVDQRGAPRVGNCDIGAYEYTISGSPTAVYAHSGSDQHAPPGSLFELPLVASVLDSLGNPVSGITVTFSAPTAGASGVFTDTGTITTTAQTTSGSLAAAAGFNANGITGSYDVTATVNGIADPALFHLRNGPGAAYVSTTGDNGNTCTEPAQPCATINAAIGHADPGEIVYVAEGTYTGEGNEVVRIEKDLILSGGWDVAFSSQVGMSTIDGENERRMVVIPDSNSNVSIENFILKNGLRLQDPGPGPFGGVFNSGNLTITNCSIQNSHHGIENRGTLLLYATTLTGNIKGIYNQGVEAVGSVVLNDSLVSNNSDGGIYSEFGVVILNRSSVINNTGAGGIYMGGGSLSLNNSTVSGNSSGNNRGGGGIFISFNGVAQRTTSIKNSSIINNSSNLGGGLSFFAGAEMLTLQNSIIAGNHAEEGSDCYVDPGSQITSAGYNLIGNTTGCSFQPATGDLVNVSPHVFPLLGSPAYHPLLRSSPAIDAGDPSGCTDHAGNPLDADQRGVARVGRCDIGAYEYDPAFDPISYISLPVAFQNLCSDFFDDFSDPSSGWFSGETDTGRIEYRDGEYSVLVKPESWYWILGAPTCDRVNYTVEADARWAGETGLSYGLVFGIQGDFEQFYSFEVNADFKMFTLYRYGPDGWVEIIPPTNAEAVIKPGAETNHLKATRNGDGITLEVNGTTLGTWYDSTITGASGSGLTVNTYSDVSNADARFDNFHVTGLGGSLISASAGPVTASGTQETVYRKVYRQGTWR